MLFPDWARSNAPKSLARETPPLLLPRLRPVASPGLSETAAWSDGIGTGTGNGACGPSLVPFKAGAGTAGASPKLSWTGISGSKLAPPETAAIASSPRFSTTV